MIGRPKNPDAHCVHLCGNLLGRAHEDLVAMDRQLEIPLIVERHRRQLSEGVFAVEHPPVGARQQRVGDVADALVGGHARSRRGTGSLNPLTLQVRGNLASDERAGASVLHPNTRPWNLGRWIEERDALATARACVAPRDTPGHDGLAIVIERRQRMQCVDRLGCENVRVACACVLTNLQHGPDYLSAWRRTASLRAALWRTL